MLRFALLLLAISTYVHALDYAVNLLQVSTSGKTILINKGLIDTVNQDDYGILLAKEDILNKQNDQFYTVYKPVAKLKAIKVLNDTSIWVAFKTFIPQAITKNAKLFLLSESELLQGRTKLKINNKKIITKKKDAADKLEETLVNDGNFLAKRKDEYYVKDEMHDFQEPSDEDVTLIDVDTWEENQIEGELKYEGFYKSPYAEEFADRKRVHRFEKMVAIFMKKFNDPNFTLKNLYIAQQKSDDGIVPKNALKNDFFNEYQRDLEETRKREDKFYKDLLSRGESWSDEYSDEELSELMYNVGVIREKERRNIIAAMRFDYQLYGSFGLNLINNENLKDRENTQQSKYDVEVALEYYFLKDIEDLNRFSLEVSFRRGQDAFTTGTLNAVSTEYSAALQLNYYPFHSPNTIEQNIVYLGFLVRYGLLSAEIPSLSEQANYQINTFPGIKAGVKYNFNSGYGARISFGFERINIEREVRTNDAGTFPDRETFIDGKLGLGISKFF